jgi:hypothetical protein
MDKHNHLFVIPEASKAMAMQKARLGASRHDMSRV